MDEERLGLLKADLDKQLVMIDQIYEEIQHRSKGYETNVERMESLAYQLHNLYCAFEDLMKIVANEFENRIQQRSDWHIQLLRRMMTDIPNIRPALFSQENFFLLDELRAFRHWFRHAYSYRVEPEKLGIVLRKAIELRERLNVDMQQFIQRLSE